MKEDLRTIEGFLEFQHRMAEERINICAKKNNDYADTSRPGDDPYKVFRNFMAVERLEICSAETGLLVRISDKFMRLSNLVRPGHKRAVMDEKLTDTIQDLQNYADLLAGLVELRKQLEKDGPH